MKGKPKKTSPWQKSLWDEWDAPLAEIETVAEKFVLANAYNPEIATAQFNSSRIYSEKDMESMERYQVSEPQDAHYRLDRDRGKKV